MPRWLLPPLLFALAGCTPTPGPDSGLDSATDDTGEALPSFVRGFGISPLGFPVDYSLMGEFYAEVGSMEGGGVMWNGGWREQPGGTDAGTIPAVAGGLPELGETYGFVPILVFGWRSGDGLLLDVPDNPTNNWTNQEAQALFLSMLREHARDTQPPFVFIGNENSAYYEQDPDDYANWIAFYEQAYDAIKAESPSTRVGTVFNYEHVSGMGALAGWDTPHWRALEAHDLDKVDLLGVTLYPYLHHAEVADLPADYLDPLFDRIGSVPVAITETGWPAEDLGDLEIPWEQSPQAQVDYLSALGGLLAGRDVPLVNWLFLNPMVDTGEASIDWQVFGSVSIRDDEGGKRPVYDAWTAFSP